MKAILATLAISTCLTPFAFGQGCVVARSTGEVGGPQSQGGYLAKGEFNFEIGYRHQFSFRHFVGDVEQTQRAALGNQVMNKINLQTLAVTYQATPRFSFTADVPILSASRHTQNSAQFYETHGLGDFSVMAQGWIWNPQENTRGNVQLGVGMLAPTGRYDISPLVDARDGKGPLPKPADYSIQPGQGGWGIPLQWAAYKNIKSTQVYFNGTYLAMLQSINDFQRSTTVNAVTKTQFNAIQDQYLLETGVAHAVPRIRGLIVTIGPRWEGVPARNLLPADNLGFRRPGYALSIEPGFQYVHGAHTFTATFGRAVYRNRTVSVPDQLTNGHGDAAFADWVWLASYSFRWNPFHAMSGHHS
jgi:hypothetical protein